MARAFAQSSNLLVLNEPTNDLDLETLDLLQARLAEYADTVLLISHDRDFLGPRDDLHHCERRQRQLGPNTPICWRSGRRRGAVQPDAPKTPLSRRSEHRSTARPHRLSFNDQRALERLPDRITALQARVAELSAALADPGLYTRDRARFSTTTEALAMARDELAAAEERWFTLEMLREEIERTEQAP